MRTWYVPLEILDDNRVVAQHRELHTIFGSVLSPRKGFQNHPVVKMYVGEHLACAIDYHAYTLREMIWRGWTGHKTPVSEFLASVAAARSGEQTCGSWQAHVQQMVARYGKYSIDGDMHDLVTRWTMEAKGLRNSLADHFVWEHYKTCKDEGCLSRSSGLRMEFFRLIGPLRYQPTVQPVLGG